MAELYLATYQCRDYYCGCTGDGKQPSAEHPVGVFSSEGRARTALGDLWDDLGLRTTITPLDVDEPIPATVRAMSDE